MKDKIRPKPKLISFYGYNDYKNKEKNQFVSKDSFTLYYDKQTKGLFKAESKNINTSKFILLFLIVYPTMNFFPNHFIPYDNNLIFISFCLIIITLSMMIGHYLNQKLIKNLRRISLSENEWHSYIEQGNRLYIIQLVFLTSLVLLLLSCFVFLYIYQSKWWMFGGIGIAIGIGTTITLYSKTRYLLYKGNLRVNLSNEEKRRFND